MAMQNQVDEAAVRQMIVALERTDADCDAAMRGVNGSISYLDSVWHGNAPSRYRSALHDWIEGLNRVQRGVRELNEAMGAHYHASARVEQDNSSQCQLEPDSTNHPQGSNFMSSYGLNPATASSTPARS